MNKKRIGKKISDENASAIAAMVAARLGIKPNIKTDRGKLPMILASKLIDPNGDNVCTIFSDSCGSKFSYEICNDRFPIREKINEISVQEGIDIPEVRGLLRGWF